jgi:hypothetical protein
VPFSEFVGIHPELHIMNLPTSTVAKFITYVKTQDISALHLPDPSGRRPIRSWMEPIAPGVIAYVDLRYWSDDGHNWYFELGLPHALTHIYVVPITYESWGPRNRSIRFDCPLFDYSDSFNTYQVFAYGSYTRFKASRMILVDLDLAAEFPEILPADSRARTLKLHRALGGKEKKKKGNVA